MVIGNVQNTMARQRQWLHPVLTLISVATIGLTALVQLGLLLTCILDYMLEETVDRSVEQV